MSYGAINCGLSRTPLVWAWSGQRVMVKWDRLPICTPDGIVGSEWNNFNKISMSCVNKNWAEMTFLKLSTNTRNQSFRTNIPMDCLDWTGELAVPKYLSCSLWWPAKRKKHRTNNNHKENHASCIMLRYAPYWTLAQCSAFHFCIYHNDDAQNQAQCQSVSQYVCMCRSYQ